MSYQPEYDDDGGAVDIGTGVRRRAAEIDETLPVRKAERAAIDAEIRALRQERRDLAAVIRALDGTGKGVPAVTNDQVLEAVRGLGIATSHDVAESLGVGPRNVARKLRKLVDDGVLSGTPEDGYGMVAV